MWINANPSNQSKSKKQVKANRWKCKPLIGAFDKVRFKVKFAVSTSLIVGVTMCCCNNTTSAIMSWRVSVSHSKLQTFDLKSKCSFGFKLLCSCFILCFSNTIGFNCSRYCNWWQKRCPSARQPDCRERISSANTAEWWPRIPPREPRPLVPIPCHHKQSVKRRQIPC